MRCPGGSSAAITAAALLSVAALLSARQDPPTQTFRTAVDLIQLDVSVLDKQRRPVPGLTAADFTILEEGKPRPIVAFVPVEVPAPATASAPWRAEIAPDVTTNQLVSKRVVVIVIDDNTLPDATHSSWTNRKVHDIAQTIVNDLGPQDLAAVVFTKDNRSAQSLTTDHRRLRAAIDASPLFPGFGTDNGGDGLAASSASAHLDPGRLDACRCNLCAIEILSVVSKALRPIQQQHKSVFYISPGVRMDDPSELVCGFDQSAALIDAFREAQLANVTIHPVDPTGLNTGVGSPGGRGGPGIIAGLVGIKAELEFLRNIAYTTGSRAVVNDNEPERWVADILNESRSYYLLGFTPASSSSPADKLRRVQVRVNRRGVDVRTRSGFYPPAASGGWATSATEAPTSLDAAMTGLMARSDVPMQVTVAPFAGEGGKAALAITVGLAPPTRASAGAGAAGVAPVVPAGGVPPTVPALDRPAERVSLVATAFDRNGRSVGTQRLTLALRQVGRYEALSRLPVPPGRYEIRLGVETGDARIGTVYAYAEVPDFAHEPLSMSGLVLSAAPSPASAPKDAFADLMPIVPTARREFGATDHVTGFVRLYQGGSRPLEPAVITTRLIDSRSAEIGSGIRRVDATSFSATRAFDDRFDLPVKLPPGEYLLTVDVAVGARTSQRAVRFTVR